MRRFYAAEMLLPYLLWPLLASGAGWAAWLPMLALPLALGLIRRFWVEAPGPGFNRLLAATAGHQFVFSVLVSGAYLLKG